METLTHTQPLEGLGHQSELVEQRLATRAGLLRELLPYDYDFASSESSGLIDMFYYDPETGEDGLMHTLAGNIVHGSNGAMTAEGFHHEPSGAIPPPTLDAESEPDLPRTPRSIVEREHLEGANSEKRRLFAEVPYDAYYAHVAINGLEKVGLQVDPSTGEKRVKRMANAMFPKEYDALAVMQTVKIAMNNRDAAQDEASVNNAGRPVKIGYGYAPMLDGKNEIKLRLIIEPESGKILTAIPIPKKSKMKLTNHEIEQHLGIA